MIRVLDLFCGAGGAAMGYYRAFGPDVYILGVDHKPQPRYPFEFIQADALEFMRDGRGDGFDFYHASPPCQAFSAMQHIHNNSGEHQDLIGPTRQLLIATRKPYVIENVPGAPLINPVMLCGTMFGLRIIRHRYFETWPELPLILMPPCNHSDVYDPWHGQGRTADKFRDAMDIDWMPLAGGRDKPGSLDLAIPPAYTEWIGRQLTPLLDV